MYQGLLAFDNDSH